MLGRRHLYGGMAIVVGLLVMVLLLLLAGCQRCPAVPLGVSHLEGLAISGAETDALVVNQTSTGDIVELRDNGVVVLRVADGGVILATGASSFGSTLGATGAISTAGALTVGGSAVITGPLGITGGGTVTVPALYLAGDSNTGLYQSAADNWDITVGGTRVASFDAAGLEVFGVLSATTTITTGNQTLLGTVAVGVDGTGHDVIFYSDTPGDYVHWDASEVVLNIIGTNAATALYVSDGDVSIVGGNVDVTGYISASSYITAANRLTISAGGAAVVGDVAITGNVDQVGDLDVTGYISASSYITAANGLTISAGGAAVVGDIDGSAKVRVGTFLNLGAAVEMSVTDGDVFTPTATYQRIVAVGEVTPTISTSGYTVGDLLVLVNADTEVINLANAGTAKLSAAWAAGQNAVLVLIFDGTNWLEISRSTN